MYRLLIFLLVTAAAAPLWQTSPSPPEQRIFELLNRERARAGLKKLEWDRQVAKAARVHSALQADHRAISHDFPGEPTVTQRLAATGVRFTISGENVARAENADEAHHGLMGSPGHRANILGADYTAVGIGVVQQGDSIYVTQDFVHKVPAYSDEQFISAVQESMNRLRKAKNIHPLVVITDPQLHQTACSTNGDAQSASAGATGVHEVFVFTLSEPAALPPRITEQASSAQTQRMKLGVCFRPDNKYGYGNFWVVAEF